MRSIILVSTGVMDIGLKSERQPGVAVLGTGHIEACFHWRGTVAVARLVEKARQWLAEDRGTETKKPSC